MMEKTCSTTWRRKFLGRLLVEKNLISWEQLDKALEIQKTVKKPLGEVLVHMGFVTEQDVSEVLAEQLKIPFVDVSSLDSIDQDVTKIIPEDLARRHTVLAIKRNERVLNVVMANPTDVVAIDDLRWLTKLEIAPSVGLKNDIIEAINKAYYGLAARGIEDVVREFSETNLELNEGKKEDQDEEFDLTQLRIQADDPPVVKFVNFMIAQAASQRASDVHVEPYSDRVRIRCRVDGKLSEMTPAPKAMHMALVSRIKVLANLDIAERRLPQDGSFGMRIDDREVDFRVSTLPTVYGEKLVLRLLEKEAISRGDFQLESLGFETEQLETFKKYIFRPQGMVLLTGPTGSGKTTTLYTVLNLIKDDTKNLVTVEDPVEYRLDGIQQVQARPEIDFSFAKALRCILRQDPDVIMVGEIRDLETAQMAVRSALTGHLVLSTLHTNDAVGVATRLINIGIEPFLTAASVSLSVAQRLVRRICPHCRESYTPDREVLESLQLERCTDGVALYRGRGCKVCRNTGYCGRIGLFEVFEITPKIREMVFQNGSEGEIKKKALEAGMMTLRQSGVRKVLSGATTVEEFLTATIEDE
jgi:type IV pilus assembly protein PilB